MTPAMIKQLLISDQDILMKCLLLLYDHQVHDEQLEKQSKHRNKVGFNSSDAKILSAYATFYRSAGRLSYEAYDKIRDRMLKYSVQISKLVEDDFFA